MNTAAVLASGAGSAGAVFLVILLIIVGLVAYVIPSIVGYVRHVRDFGSVVVINLLLGWSLIGWAVALAMALRTATTEKWAAGQVGDEAPSRPRPQQSGGMMAPPTR